MELPISANKRWSITPSEFKGARLLNVRQQYKDKEGKWQFGKQGLSLPYTDGSVLLLEEALNQLKAKMPRTVIGSKNMAPFSGYIGVYARSEVEHYKGRVYADKKHPDLKPFPNIVKVQVAAGIIKSFERVKK